MSASADGKEDVAATKWCSINMRKKGTGSAFSRVDGTPQSCSVLPPAPSVSDVSGFLFEVILSVLFTLALAVLAHLKPLVDEPIQPFWYHEPGRRWQVQRLTAVSWIALLLGLCNLAHNVALPQFADAPAISQEKVSALQFTLGNVHVTPNSCLFLWGHRYVNPLFGHISIIQHNREAATAARQPVPVTRASAFSASIPLARPTRRSAAAAVRYLVQTLEHIPGTPSSKLCMTGRVTPLRRPAGSLSRSSLQLNFLSASGALRQRTQSFLPSPITLAPTQWARSGEGDQLVCARLTVNHSAARGDAASAALALWKSNPRGKAGFLAVLHSVQMSLWALARGCLADDEARVDIPEERVPTFEGDDDFSERTGAPQEIRVGRQDASTKWRKDDFESAVSNKVLRGMVISGLLYDEKEEELALPTNPPFIVEGPRFNGTSPFACPPWGPMKRMVPYDRSLASLPSVGDVDAAAAAPFSHVSEGTRNATQGASCFWTALAKHTTTWDLYAQPGSRVQDLPNSAVLVTPPVTPNRVFMWTKHDIERGAYEDPYADGTVRHEEPSYLNPVAAALRTGRARDAHRRTDTGRKQKERWGMENITKDIPRGNWSFADDIYKDMLDSVDWEREWPHLHDTNYYKRSHCSTLVGDNDRNEDSYWDLQFLGGVDTYARVLPSGMKFTWPVYWVPWLCKKHPRRGGQPLKSEPFNLGGVEPLQLWFYPDGCELSHPGFCSLKLVSRPGWNIPFQIKLWIAGGTVNVPAGPASETGSPSPRAPVAFQREASTRCRARLSDRKGEDAGKTGAGTLTSDMQTAHFSSKVEIGPVRREEADYVAYSASFCRLVDKGSFLRTPDYPFPPFGDAHPHLPIFFNPATDVVLGAAGDVEIGVAVAENNWEWDDGHWGVEQWLKLQSAYPDDLELEETLPTGFTNSDMFENYKYRDVPDKHYAKYLPSALPPALEGEAFNEASLNLRHQY